MLLKTFFLILDDRICKFIYKLTLIQKSLSPRIIFTTSGISKKAKAFWGPYAVSKAGINALADILIDELEPVSDIRIFNFNPKATRTDMRSIAYPAENPSKIKKPEISPVNVPKLLFFFRKFN